MEKSNNTKKWNDYFGNIRAKYDLRVNPKKPLVIFLDGKNVTTGKDFNLLNSGKDSFIDVMEQTVKYFTYQYDCIAICGVDEVSFIMKSAESIIDKINSSRNFRSNEITSVFSQYFFEYFNKINKNNVVYWHAKCYSIPTQKVQSYIKYRSKVIFNTFTTYFLKKNMVKNAGKMNPEDKIKLCKQMDYYDDIEKYARGIVYYKGEQIDLDEYLNGNIKIVKENKKENSEYIDPKAFNELF